MKEEKNIKGNIKYICLLIIFMAIVIGIIIALKVSEKKKADQDVIGVVIDDDTEINTTEITTMEATTEEIALVASEADAKLEEVASATSANEEHIDSIVKSFDGKEAEYLKMISQYEQDMELCRSQFLSYGKNNEAFKDVESKPLAFADMTGDDMPEFIMIHKLAPSADAVSLAMFTYNREEARFDGTFWENYSLETEDIDFMFFKADGMDTMLCYEAVNKENVGDINTDSAYYEIVPTGEYTDYEKREIMSVHISENGKIEYMIEGNAATKEEYDKACLELLDKANELVLFNDLSTFDEDIQNHLLKDIDQSYFTIQEAKYLLGGE